MKKNIKYKLTSGLIVAGLALAPTVAFADNTTPAPVSSPSAYQTQLVAYKAAVVQYRVALVNNDISYRAAMIKYRTDWNATMKAYWTAWQSAITTFKTARADYEAKVDPIQAAHKSAMDAADNAFLAATTGTPTNEALNAALKTYWAAAKAANTAYKTAVAALGAEPVKPIQPTAPVKPAAPIKPADPVKPVAPVKPAKATKTK